MSAPDVVILFKAFLSGIALGVWNSVFELFAQVVLGFQLFFQSANIDRVSDPVLPDAAASQLLKTKIAPTTDVVRQKGV